MVTLIELTGPASAGKTTLAKQLAEKNGWHLVLEPYIDDVENVVTDTDLTKGFQQKMLEEHYDNLMMALQAGKTVITDRCLLDVGIYTILYFNKNDGFYQSYLDTVSKAYDNILAYYDDVYTFHCKSVGFEDNGVRRAVNYDDEVAMFEEHGRFVAPMKLSNDHDKRINEVEEYVRNH